MCKDKSLINKLLSNASSVSIILSTLTACITSSSVTALASTVETAAANATIGDGNVTTGTVGTPVWSSGDNLVIHDNGVTVTTSGDTTLGAPNINFGGKTGVTIVTNNTLSANNITFTHPSQSLKLNDGAIINLQPAANDTGDGTINVHGDCTINHQYIGYMGNEAINEVNINTAGKTLTISHGGSIGNYNTKSGFNFVADGTIKFTGDRGFYVNSPIFSDVTNTGSVVIDTTYTNNRILQFAEVGKVGGNAIGDFDLQASSATVNFSEDVNLNNLILSGDDAIVQLINPYADYQVNNLKFTGANAIITTASGGGMNEITLNSTNITNNSGVQYTGLIKVVDDPEFKITSDIGNSGANEAIKGLQFGAGKATIRGQQFYGETFSNTGGGNVYLESAAAATNFDISVNMVNSLSSLTINPSGGNASGTTPINLIANSVLKTNNIYFSPGHDHSINIESGAEISGSSGGTSTIIKFSEQNQKVTVNDGATLDAYIRPENRGLGIIETFGNVTLKITEIDEPIKELNINTANSTVTLNNSNVTGNRFYKVLGGINFNDAINFIIDTTAQTYIDSDFNLSADNADTITITTSGANNNVFFQGIGDAGKALKLLDAKALDEDIFFRNYDINITELESQTTAKDIFFYNTIDHPAKIGTIKLNSDTRILNSGTRGQTWIIGDIVNATGTNNQGYIDSFDDFYIQGNIGGSGANESLKSVDASTHNMIIEGDYVYANTLEGSGNITIRAANAPANAGEDNYIIATSMPSSAISLLTLEHSPTAKIATNAKLTDGSSLKASALTFAPGYDHSLTLAANSTFSGQNTAEGVIYFTEKNQKLIVNEGTTLYADIRTDIPGSGIIEFNGDLTLNSSYFTRFIDRPLNQINFNTANATINFDAAGTFILYAKNGINVADGVTWNFKNSNNDLFASDIILANNMEAIVIDAATRHSYFQKIGDIAGGKALKLLDNTSNANYIHLKDEVNINKYSSGSTADLDILYLLGAGKNYKIDTIEFQNNSSVSNYLANGDVYLYGDILNKSGSANIGQVQASSGILHIFGNIGSKLDDISIEGLRLNSNMIIEGDHLYANNLNITGSSILSIRAANAPANAGEDNYTIKTNTPTNPVSNLYIEHSPTAKVATNIELVANSVLRASNITFQPGYDHSLKIGTGSTLVSTGTGNTVINFTESNQKLIINDGCNIYSDIRAEVAGSGIIDINGDVTLKTSRFGVDTDRSLNQINFNTANATINFDAAGAFTLYAKNGINVADGVTWNFKNSNNDLYASDIILANKMEAIVIDGATRHSYFQKIGDIAGGKALKLLDNTSNADYIHLNDEVNINKYSSGSTADLDILYLRGVGKNYKIDTIEFQNNSRVSNASTNGDVYFYGDILNKSGSANIGQVQASSGIVHIFGNIGSKLDDISIEGLKLDSNMIIEGDHLYANNLNITGSSSLIIRAANAPANAGEDNYTIKTNTPTNPVSNLYIEHSPTAKVATNIDLVANSVLRASNIIFQPGYDHSLRIGSGSTLVSTGTGNTVINFTEPNQKLIINDGCNIYSDIRAEVAGSGIIDINGDVTLKTSRFGVDTDRPLNQINFNTANATINFDAAGAFTLYTKNGINVADGVTWNFKNSNNDLFASDIILANNMEAIVIDAATRHSYFQKIGDIAGGKALKLLDNTSNANYIHLKDEVNINKYSSGSTADLDILYLLGAGKNYKIDTIEFQNNSRASNYLANGDVYLYGDILNKSGSANIGQVQASTGILHIFGNIGSKLDDISIEGLKLDSNMIIEGDHLYANNLNITGSSILSIRAANAPANAGEDNYTIKTNTPTNPVSNLYIEHSPTAKVATNIELVANSVLRASNITFQPGYDHSLKIGSGSTLVSTGTNNSVINFTEPNQKLIIGDGTSIYKNIIAGTVGDGSIDFIGSSTVNSFYIGKSVPINTINLLGNGGDVKIISTNIDYVLETTNGIHFKNDAKLTISTNRDLTLNSDIKVDNDGQGSLIFDDAGSARTLQLQQVGEAGKALGLIDNKSDAKTIYFNNYPVHISKMIARTANANIYLRNPDYETCIETLEIENEILVSTSGARGKITFVGDMVNTSGTNNTGTLQIQDLDLIVRGNVGDNAANGALRGTRFSSANLTAIFEGEQLYVETLNLDNTTTEGNIIIKSKTAGTNFTIGTQSQGNYLTSFTVDHSGGASGVTNLITEPNTVLKAVDFNLAPGYNHSLTVGDNSLIEATNFNLNEIGQTINLSTGSTLQGPINSPPDIGGFLNINGDSTFDGTNIGSIIRPFGELKLSAQLTLPQETKIYAKITSANAGTGTIVAAEDVYFYGDIGNAASISTIDIADGKSIYLRNSITKAQTIKLNAGSTLTNDNGQNSVLVEGNIINDSGVNNKGIIDAKHDFRIIGDIGQAGNSGTIAGISFNGKSTVIIEGSNLYADNLNLGGSDDGTINLGSSTAGGNFALYTNMGGNTLNYLNIQTSGGNGISNVSLQDNATLIVKNVAFKMGYDHSLKLGANASIIGAPSFKFSKSDQVIELGNNSSIGQAGNAANFHAADDGYGIIALSGDATIITSGMGEKSHHALAAINLNTANILSIDNDDNALTIKAKNINFLDNATLKLMGNNDYNIIGKINATDQGSIIIDNSIIAGDITFTGDISTSANALSNFDNQSNTAKITLASSVVNIENLTLAGDTTININHPSADIRFGNIVNNIGEGTLALSSNAKLFANNGTGNQLKQLELKGNIVQIRDGSKINVGAITTSLPGVGQIRTEGDVTITTDDIGSANAIDSLNILSANKILTIENNGNTPNYNITNNIVFEADNTLKFAGDADIPISAPIISNINNQGTIVIDSSVTNRTISFNNQVGTISNAIKNIDNQSANATVIFSGSGLNTNLITFAANTIAKINTANARIANSAGNANEGVIQIATDTRLYMDNSAGNRFAQLEFNADHNLTLESDSVIKTTAISSNNPSEGILNILDKATLMTSSIGVGNSINVINLNNPDSILTFDNSGLAANYFVNNGINFVEKASIAIKGDADVTINAPILFSEEGGDINIDPAIGIRLIKFNDSIGTITNWATSLNNNSTQANIEFAGSQTYITTLNIANDTSVIFNKDTAKVEFSRINNIIDKVNFEVAANTSLSLDNSTSNRLRLVNFPADNTLTLGDNTIIYTKAFDSTNPGQGTIAASGNATLITNSIGATNSLKQIEINTIDAELVLDNLDVAANYAVTDAIIFNDQNYLRIKGDANIDLNSPILSKIDNQGTFIIDSNITNRDINLNNNIGQLLKAVGHVRVDSDQANINFNGNLTNIEKLTISGNNKINLNQANADVRFGSVENQINQGVLSVRADTNLEMNNVADAPILDLLFEGDNSLTLSDGSGIFTKTISTLVANQGSIIAIGDATLKTDSSGISTPLNTIHISGAGKTLTLDNFNIEAKYSLNNGIIFAADGTLKISGDGDVNLDALITANSGGEGTILIDASLTYRTVSFSDVGTSINSVSHIQNDSANSTLEFKGSRVNIDQLTLGGNSTLRFDSNAANVSIGSLVNNPNEGKIIISQNTNLNFDNKDDNSLRSINFESDTVLNLSNNSSIYVNEISSTNPSEGQIDTSGNVIIKSSSIGHPHPIKLINILAANTALTIDNNNTEATYNISSAINLAANNSLIFTGDANIELNSKITTSNAGDGTVEISNLIGARNIRFNENIDNLGHINNKSTNATLIFDGDSINTNLLTLADDSLVILSANSANIKFTNVATSNGKGEFRITEDLNLSFDNNTGNSIAKLTIGGDYKLSLEDGTFIHANQIATDSAGEGTIFAKGNATLVTSDIGSINGLESLVIGGIGDSVILDNKGIAPIYNLTDSIIFANDGKLELKGDADITINTPVVSDINNIGSVIIDAGIGAKDIKFNQEFGAETVAIANLIVNSNAATIYLNGSYSNINSLSLNGNTTVDIRSRVNISSLSNNVDEGKIQISGDTTLSMNNDAGNILNEIIFAGDHPLTLTNGSKIKASFIMSNFASQGTINIPREATIKSNNIGGAANLKEINILGNESLTLDNNNLDAVYQADILNFSQNGKLLLTGDANIDMQTAIIPASSSNGAIEIDNSINVRQIDFQENIGSIDKSLGKLHNKSTNATIILSAPLINIENLTLDGNSAIRLDNSGANVTLSNIINNPNSGSIYIDQNTNFSAKNNSGNQLSNLNFTGNYALNLNKESYIHVASISTNAASEGKINIGADVTLKTSNIGIGNAIGSINITNQNSILTLDNSGTSPNYTADGGINFNADGTFILAGNADIAMNNSINTLNPNDGTIIIANSVGAKYVNFNKSIGSSLLPISKIDIESIATSVRFAGPVTDVNLIKIPANNIIELSGIGANIRIGSLINEYGSGTLKISANSNLEFDNRFLNPLGSIIFATDSTLTLSNDSALYATGLSTQVAEQGTLALAGSANITAPISGNSLKLISLEGGAGKLVSFSKEVKASNIIFTGNSTVYFADKVSSNLLELRQDSKAVFSKENLIYNISTTEGANASDGIIEFTNINMSINSDIGSNIKPLQEINFTNSGKSIAVDANLYADEINFRDSLFTFNNNNQELQGNITFNGSTIDLGTKQLTVNGGNIEISGNFTLGITSNIDRGQVVSNSSIINVAGGTSLEVEFNNVDNMNSAFPILDFTGAPDFSEETISAFTDATVRVIGVPIHNWHIMVSGNIISLTDDIIAPPAPAPNNQAEVESEIGSNYYDNYSSEFEECPNVQQALRLQPQLRSLLDAPAGSDAYILLKSLCSVPEENISKTVKKIAISPTFAQNEVLQSSIDYSSAKISDRLADFIFPTFGVAAGDDDIPKRVPKHGLWYSTSMSTASQIADDDSNQYGYKSNQLINILGFDSKITDKLTAGCALILSNNGINYLDEKEDDKASINSKMLSMYSYSNFMNVQFNNIFSLGMNEIDGKSIRTNFNNQDEIALSKYNTISLTYQGEVSFEVKTQDLSLSPLIGMHYSRLGAYSYQETGTTNLNLHTKSSAQNNLTGIFGVRLNAKPKQLGLINITPSFHIKASRQLINPTHQVELKLSGSDEQINREVKAKKKTGLNMAFSANFEYNNFSCTTGYSIAMSHNYTAHAGTLNLKIKF